MKPPFPCRPLWWAGLFAFMPLGLVAQEADEAATAVFELSPFEVTTVDDDRYYASNSISGSRLDVRIQDIPLTIEVLTSEFVKDTGATDLRESLRYSAGILLQSQNDAFGGGFDNAGGVNNPEGATGDRGESSFKIRGFVTNNTLRNGFRRQHATDTVNIDRIEVVRGPSAILYGVGNFGGVVNYLPKRPLDFVQTEVTLGFGSDAWRRASLDTTGPLPAGFGYRLTAAYQERDHWTELNNANHYFVSPVLEWRWNKTRVVLDFEYGEAEENAIGFQSVRAPTLVGVPITQSDRLETYGFLEFEGEAPRTFRWSGSDTFLNTLSWNLNLTLEQELLEDMFLLVGYNRSYVEFAQRDIFGGIRTTAFSARAQPLVNSIEAIQIIDGQNSDVRVPVEQAVLRYSWNETLDEIDWDQVRVELNYKKRLFESSRWFNSEHSLLAGYSWEQQQNDSIVFRQEPQPDNDNFFYKDPQDSTPIRFDAPTDGSVVTPFRADELRGNVTENEGIYAVYSGRYLDDRLFIVAGTREDTTSNRDGYEQFPNTSLRNPELNERRDLLESEVTKRTGQYGISYEVLSGLTVYALSSEGVEPNFGGERDGIGRALESSVAESREIGIKVDILESKLAATFSAFKIEREGLPFSYWWAPAPARGRFDPNANIIYRMDDWNLDNNGSNPYLSQARAEWETAKAANAVFTELNPGDGREYVYLNASVPEGAAYLDRVFAALQAEFDLPRAQRNDNDPWAGWLFTGIEDEVDDQVVNFAGLDNSSGDFFQTISDESEGWEAQVIWTPTDNFQLILNYSNVERTVVDPGNFVSYPYAEGNWDRWAMWYFPNANWGLAGVAPDVAYPGGAPGQVSQDTSDWAGVGWGEGESLDDTPEHAVSWWARYDFIDGPLDGLQFGFGGQWESEREYASALTTSGQQKQNETDTVIRAVTDPRLTINLMTKYAFTVMEDLPVTVQLNVDNALDDTDQYGLVYAPGRSWRLTTSILF